MPQTPNNYNEAGANVKVNYTLFYLA